MKRRFLALVLSMLLICTFTTGAMAETSSAHIDGELRVLTFATFENSDPTNSYTKILPVWAELQARTGIEIIFDVVPTDQYPVTMSTRLAAGVNLPDIVRLPTQNPVLYANSGLIIPLKQLIAEHAPNITAMFERREDVKRTLTAPDGEIYALDSIVDARSQVNYADYGIRKDWLEKLGLQQPDTIDDFYNMLVAFKTQDPNGNGQQDEIPLTGRRTPTSCGLFEFGWAYGLHLMTSEGWYADDNNKIIYEWTDPRMKDYLTEMNKWYSEGLIDPEFLTQDSDTHVAKCIGDIAGADFADFTMMFPQWNIRMQENFPGARWESTTPVQGPNGDRIIERESATAREYYAITRDCKDPVVAIKWLDYMYGSDEGQNLLVNFGIEGVTYDMVDGKPMLNDTILKHERGSGLGMEMHGMNGPFLRVLKSEMIEQRFMQYEGEIAQGKITTQYYVAPFPVILATEEETTQFASIMADLNTLREEYIFDFITGRKPIDQFESYVDMMTTMGIDRAIEIKQQQYDRYMAS